MIYKQRTYTCNKNCGNKTYRTLSDEEFHQTNMVGSCSSCKEGMMLPENCSPESDGTSAAIISGRMNASTMPRGFRDKLGLIKKAHPGSNFNTHGG